MMFCEYLGKVENHPQTFALMKEVPKILEIDWVTKRNFVDCGVFVMRHMECYKGTGLKDFKIQLESEGAVQKRQLEDLRKRYVTKILLSDLNDDVEHVRAEVKCYDRLDEEQRAKHKKNAKVNINRHLAKKLCV